MGFLMQAGKFKKRPNKRYILGWLAIVMVMSIAGASIFAFAGHKQALPSKTRHDIKATLTAKIIQPLFQDTFADNMHKWQTGTYAGYSSAVGKNQMSLYDANHKLLIESIQHKTFSDYKVVTHFALWQADKNDAVGLYLRGDVTLHQGYFIDIYGDNTYDVVKVAADATKNSSLIFPTFSGSIHSMGQLNTLEVDIKGPKAVLILNNMIIKSFTDSSYSNGTIGLFVQNGNTSNGVKATFYDITIYSAPENLPG
ncbi:MAG: hypothetical protein M3Z24_01720 [Chloroflexota bacterium]|nr:hypothetical protein [Chloroflexota bacterium]